MSFQQERKVTEKVVEKLIDRFAGAPTLKLFELYVKDFVAILGGLG